jgi:polyphosphate:AMP phosphotransferase
MFESAELGHQIDKLKYEQEAPNLRHALLNAQYEVVKERRFPVLILIAGIDGAGKGETVNLLNEWMDPRHISTNALRPLGDGQQNPHMWRFWRALPAKGKFSIFIGSWYTQPLIERVYGEIRKPELTQHLERINRFERMLVDEGALLLKFWFHLSRDAQKRRLRKLAKNPKTAWRVTDTDWRHFDLYDRFRRISEHVLRETSSADAPWIVVEGVDERYRNLTVAKAVLGAIQKRTTASEVRPREVRAPPLIAPVDGASVLDKLDLAAPQMAKDEYLDLLEEQQGRIARLLRSAKFRRCSAVAVFEGSDAAGKGGAIRRLTQALDARQYDVVPIAAPSDEEKARPYLWRFWRHLPERGRMVIFDRSWYGRVLVERVEGFCSESDWMRAYSEINDFEEQLADNRTLVVKFWLQVSKEEQLRRFKEREQTPFKQYKISSEDWRNREKWDAYRLAVSDMVDRTSTQQAPWTLVEANDKYHARIKVLRTLGDRLEAELS